MAKRKPTRRSILTRSINYLGHAIGSLDRYASISDKEGDRLGKADLIVERMVKIYYAMQKLK